jgi:hypothetical protein
MGKARLPWRRGFHVHQSTFSGAVGISAVDPGKTHDVSDLGMEEPRDAPDVPCLTEAGGSGLKVKR